MLCTFLIISFKKFPWLIFFLTVSILTPLISMIHAILHYSCTWLETNQIQYQVIHCKLMGVSWPIIVYLYICFHPPGYVTLFLYHGVNISRKWHRTGGRDSNSSVIKVIKDHSVEQFVSVRKKMYTQIGNICIIIYWKTATWKALSDLNLIKLSALLCPRLNKCFETADYWGLEKMHCCTVYVLNKMI